MVFSGGFSEYPRFAGKGYQMIVVQIFESLTRYSGARAFPPWGPAGCCLAAWSVDRIGRSLRHLLFFFDELRALHVDLYLHKEGIDTSTPAGEAMFQMVGVFAQFERSMIRERVRSGLSRARASGKRLGRPPVTARKRAEVLKLRRAGQSIRAVARTVRLSARTVQKIK
ncbi:MAG: recombinase family protein [Gemmatimonadetes bacterium]|nr:recombinase family protein [Gemmatimonadota bacterium]